MSRLERINIDDPSGALPAVFRHALAARTLLEKVWDHETAYQGIELTADDAVSRGQCGVSTVWLGRHLAAQGVEAYFTEGLMAINGGTDEHVRVEARNIAPEPYIIDITSDQYQTIHGATVHVGAYGDDHISNYQPQEFFDPFAVPHKKLMARYALMESKIARLPRRHRLRVK